MLSDAQRVRADRTFKQEQKEAEAAQVWRDVAKEQEAVAAKTARLRALRLARDANEKPPNTIRQARS
jgi:hypothetical protein